MIIKNTYIVLVIMLSSIVTFAQNADITYGMIVDEDGVIQMHEGAKLGIHTHLENDGTFDENKGFTGFYSDIETLTVYGDNRPIFNNVDVQVMDNLELFNSVGVKGEFRFIEGKVITPRDPIEVSLDYISHDFHIGQNDSYHVDGYTTHRGQEAFTFPVGDDDKYRPMILPSQSSITTEFQGAYFYDDPESIINDSDLSEISFDTTKKIYFINNISDVEFWDLNGSTETQVTLTWDEDSDIQNISNNDLKTLIVTGWSIENERWESLGNVSSTGNMDTGRITSVGFVPNAYDIITFAGIRNKSNNFYISPNNGDDLNQTVFFDELTEYDRGIFKVFNRWGNIVYESDDYQNDFDGISNGRATIRKERKLPTGTYFYELEYGNGNFENLLEGWIYIVND